MKFLVVVTPPSIYHGCSTWMTLWEEKFTGKKYLFQYVKMKNFGRRKVRKHKEIKGSDKIVTLNASAKFENLNKMETTSSESKGKSECNIVHKTLSQNNSSDVPTNVITELKGDKVSWTMLHSDSLTSLEIFSDKVSCMMIYFDFPRL